MVTLMRGKTASLTAALALCASFGAAAKNFYVAPNGSDLANGDAIEMPLKTVQKAVERAGAGDTVFLRAGEYRESVRVPNGGAQGQPLLIAAYRDEAAIIKGSDVVTGWENAGGGLWKKTGWNINSQQVFVDFDEARQSRPLQQIGMPSRFYRAFEYPKPVGTGVQDMGPGSFYYDAAAATLYVRLADGSDPNRHRIEVSTRKTLFHADKPYVNLQGLRFRHSSVSAFAQQGGAVEVGPESVMDRCDVQWTDFAGVNLGLKQTGVRIVNSNISNNGNSGINAPATLGFVISKVTLNGNNYRGFNPLWHAGGIKATTKAWGTVEKSEVAGNRGSGIWFDYANGDEPIIVRDNYIHDNGPVDSAIFFEVSSNGQIYNNVIANNERRGIYISGSDNTRVYNNTIYATKGYAGIELGGLPRDGATLTRNRVYNNIISNGQTRYDLIIMPPNGASIASNESDYNNIFRPGEPIRLSSAGNYTDLAAWQKATRMDARSLSADPHFVAPGSPRAAADLEVKPDSPAARGGTQPEAAADQGAAPQARAGGAYAMGARAAARP